MKRFFKSKRGMTYIELLVALSLLALIIVSFTPMLLKSYETLYDAGKVTTDTYNAKSELELGLATRVNKNITDINMQFNTISETVKISLRKVTSILQEGMETLFYGGRGSIRLISEGDVNDDTDEKSFAIQAVGINIDNIVYGGKESAKKETDTANNNDKYTVALEAFVPFFKETIATSDEAFSDKNSKLPANRVIIPNNIDKKSGNIFTIKIKGCDLTTTVIKVVLYYIDENNTERSTELFIHIHPPTILLAGGTNANVHYYTTAGVDKEAEKNSGSGTEAVPLKVESRKMTGKAFPDNITFKNVCWVDKDDSDLNHYYVLTGSNGVIQRFYSGIGKAGNDKVKEHTKSKLSHIPYKENNIEKTAAPAFWGGDKSHMFEYSSYKHSANYGKNEDDKPQNCWLTGDQTADCNNGNGYPGDNIYGTQALYRYYFNGDAMGFSYPFQNSKTISYIITERGKPLRLFGKKKRLNDFKGFTANWYNYSNGDYYSNDLYHYGGYKDGDLNLSSIGMKHTNRDQNKIILWGACASGKSNDYSDNSFASIRLKSMGSYGLKKGYDTNCYDYMDPAEDGAERDSNRILKNDNGKVTANNNFDLKQAQDIMVTDSVLLPNSDGKTKSILYVGNIRAFANVIQTDSIKDTKRPADSDNAGIDGYKNDWEKTPIGAITDYIIASDGERGTVIHKLTGKKSGEWNGNDMIDGRWSVNDRREYLRVDNYLNLIEKYGDPTEGMGAFYGNRNDLSVKDKNLRFTLGYSSNREKIYKDIVYNGTTEFIRSYEHYYYASHYGEPGVTAESGTVRPNHAPNRALHGDTTNKNINSYDNDYYNVWFPGEMYNISHIASKEGITVGVGYAVAGSAFQYINVDNNEHTSTALGGIYNDGVLAAAVGGESSLTNLLYFKDNATMDNNSLTEYTFTPQQYRNAYSETGYGTHARDSVRFTAVDILVNSSGTVGDPDTDEEISAAGENIDYYAVYGDNKGRVFFSLIAEKKGKGEAKEVEYIADLTNVNKDTAPSKMRELKFENKSLSDVFSEIKSIVADSTTVVISGKGRNNKQNIVVVKKILEEKGTEGNKTYEENWVVKKIPIESLLNCDVSKTEINDMLIFDGYVYLAGGIGAVTERISGGIEQTTGKGFLLAIPLQNIQDICSSNLTSKLKGYLVKDLPTPIYSLAGNTDT